jgi:hypothetical protein
LLLVLTASPSCDKKQAAQTDNWSIRLETSGGFAGRGNGNVDINSEGKISFEKPKTPVGQSTPCTGKLAAEDLKQLRTLVSNAKVAGWQGTGINVAAPDAFGYKLTLSLPSETSSVQWYDNTRDKLPDDLKNVVAAVNKAKEKQAAVCEKQ